MRRLGEGLGRRRQKKESPTNVSKLGKEVLEQRDGANPKLFVKAMATKSQVMGEMVASIT